MGSSHLHRLGTMAQHITDDIGDGKPSESTGVDDLMTDLGGSAGEFRPRENGGGECLDHSSILRRALYSSALYQAAVDQGLSGLLPIFVQRSFLILGGRGRRIYSGIPTGPASSSYAKQVHDDVPPSNLLSRHQLDHVPAAMCPV